MADVILTFNGNKYELSKLRGIAASGPTISVKAEDLNPFEGKEFEALLDKHVPEFHTGTIIFYKQNGKYTVLGGRDSARSALNQDKTELTGRLISSPALKRAKVQEAVPEINSGYANEFKNSPRFNDRNNNDRHQSTGSSLRSRSPYSSQRPK